MWQKLLRAAEVAATAVGAASHSPLHPSTPGGRVGGSKTVKFNNSGGAGGGDDDTGADPLLDSYISSLSFSPSSSYGDGNNGRSLCPIPTTAEKEAANADGGCGGRGPAAAAAAAVFARLWAECVSEDPTCAGFGSVDLTGGRCHAAAAAYHAGVDAGGSGNGAPPRSPPQPTQQQWQEENNPPASMSSFSSYFCPSSSSPVSSGFPPPPWERVVTGLARRGVDVSRELTRHERVLLERELKDWSTQSQDRESTLGGGNGREAGGGEGGQGGGADREGLGMAGRLALAASAVFDEGAHAKNAPFTPTFLSDARSRKNNAVTVVTAAAAAAQKTAGGGSLISNGTRRSLSLGGVDFPAVVVEGGGGGGGGGELGSEANKSVSHPTGKSEAEGGKVERELDFRGVAIEAHEVQQYVEKTDDAFTLTLVFPLVPPPPLPKTRSHASLLSVYRSAAVIIFPRTFRGITPCRCLLLSFVSRELRLLKTLPYNDSCCTVVCTRISLPQPRESSI